jgi:hypothetical protein
MYTWETLIYGYDIVGYSTVGTYTEHVNDITTAYEKFREFMEWANRVEIVDLEYAEVFEEWEREV